MILKEAIFHKIEIIKEKGKANTLNYEPSPVCLPVDELLAKTALDINRVYKTKLSNFGTFSQDRELYRFPELLVEYHSEKLMFINFTQRVGRIIANKMIHENFATSGYVVFLRYTIDDVDFLLVLMLKLKAGVGFDDKTYTLKESFVFDTSHLHEAACIDLGKWCTDQSPYLSFIKKRNSNQDVTLYFRESLGCTDYIDAKKSTQLLLDALHEYSKACNWSADDKIQASRKVFDYCEEKRRDKEPLNLIALSAILNDQEPDSFTNFIKEKEYTLSDVFEADVKTYKRLQRVESKIGSIKLSFDVDDVLNSKIDYDKQDNLLIIRDIPEELANKLLEIKAD